MLFAQCLFGLANHRSFVVAVAARQRHYRKFAAVVVAPVAAAGNHLSWLDLD